MVEVLLAGVLAMVISIVAGPKFIDFLRKNEFGQHIREEGPQGHSVKQGTPAMGGLLIMISNLPRPRFRIQAASLARIWPGKNPRVRRRRTPPRPDRGSSAGAARGS